MYVGYPKIKKFADVVKYARRFLDAPTVTFEGTVKIHGTNAGVTCDADGNIGAQSRNRALSRESDNFGFAQFVADNQSAFKRAFHDLGLLSGVLYGEWCGSGIQRVVAVSKLDRHFVVFAALDLVSGDLITIPRDLVFLSDHVHNVHRAGTVEVTVNLGCDTSVREAAQFATELTEAYEQACPWGKLFGIEGVGEGLVWKPLGAYSAVGELMFKTKGEKHTKGPEARKPSVKVAPEILAGVQDFVNERVTEARLKQGVDYIQEMFGDATVRQTGDYLKWVAGDLSAECAAELEASGLTWKQVSRPAMAKARKFYIAAVESV